MRSSLFSPRRPRQISLTKRRRPYARLRPAPPGHALTPASRGRMGPGGLPSLQNCVSGGAPLTGGFDTHAPSPIEPKWTTRVESQSWIDPGHLPATLGAGSKLGLADSPTSEGHDVSRCPRTH